MIITIVADVFGESNNGTTITIKRLVSKLKERGHELRVVSSSPSDEPGRYTLEKRNFYVFNDYLSTNGVELAKPDENVLREAFTGADIVHIAMPFKTGKHAVKLANEMHIPVTGAVHVQAENVTAHFFMKDVKLANDLVYKYFYNTFYRYLHFVHCPSQMIADVLREHGYENMDFRVISNGVDDEFRPIPNAVRDPEWEGKYVIAFTGRLSREKMHATLLEAVSLSKHKDIIQLLFAGEGPQHKKLEKKGAGLPNPLLINFYTRTELINLLNTIDLYVHPSEAEIEGISCLEAMACGAVPLVSDSPASATGSFALSEYNLFRSGDANDLAEKIDFMIEHPQVKDALREKYIAFSENFRIDHCIDQMEKMFADAIEYYKNLYRE